MMLFIEYLTARMIFLKVWYANIEQIFFIFKSIKSKKCEKFNAFLVHLLLTWLPGLKIKPESIVQSIAFATEQISEEMLHYYRDIFSKNSPFAQATALLIQTL